MTDRRRGRPEKAEYVSPRGAAEIMTARGYEVGARTVARMCDRGQLTSIRPGAGRYRRILRSSIEDFLRTAIDTTDSGV